MIEHHHNQHADCHNDCDLEAQEVQIEDIVQQDQVRGPDPCTPDDERVYNSTILSGITCNLSGRASRSEMT